MMLRTYKSTDYQKLKALLLANGMYYELIDNEKALQEKISKFPDTIVIAQENDEIIGCCYFIIDPTHEYVMHLCVKEGFRSMGIGTKLLEEVEKRIKRLNSKHEPILLVEEDNATAIAFYKKHGWEPHEGRRYYMMKKKL